MRRTPPTLTAPTQARSVPDPATAAKPKEGHRESVESVVFVLVVFLLFGFEAQGFMIPTGSMATTLMGKHKEIACPQCGYTFQVNVPEGVEPVVRGTCPNCRYVSDLAGEPVNGGDRIYVSKVPVDQPRLPGSGLRRWDIVVFKFPEEPQVPYIKRMVGLPGETVRVRSGDILVSPRGGDGAFRYDRRPSATQDDMQVVVYDDAFRPKALASDPRWRRWSDPKIGGWREPDAGRYVTAESTSGWTELRYRHVVPEPDHWAAIRENRPLPYPPRPTLVTDFIAYNTDVELDRRGNVGPDHRAWFQPHWVGDLTLSLRLAVESKTGEVRLELIKGGVANRCVIDLATGMATLFHGDETLGDPAPTRVRGPGTYELTFANVDERLTLSVDGRLPFGDGRAFGDGTGPVARPTPADLSPAAVAVRGASASVTGLVLKRDVYYTQYPGQADDREFSPSKASDLFDLLADPDRLASLMPPSSRDFPLASGRYLMFGDNSPWSRDGRAWTRADRRWDPTRSAWEVPESLLIGKAFVLYWPHLKPFGPQVRVGNDFRLPARPYFERMKWVR